MTETATANDTQAAIPPHVPRDHVVDFDMYAPPGVGRDFHAAWRKLQEPGVPDIVWTPRNGGHWIATRGKLIQDIFGNYEKFSNNCILVPRELGDQHQLLPTTIDPPEHRPYRMLLNASLSPKAVSNIEQKIRHLAASLVEGVRARGHCNFTTDFAEVLPIHIFMMMMDLPVTDAGRMKLLVDQVTRPDGSITLAEAKKALGDYLEPYVDARMANPGSDMVSRMVSGSIDGRPLTKKEAMDLSIQILIAGLDTVVNFLSFAVMYLAENAEHRRELVNNPDLIPAAADEFFRRYPLVTIGRLIKQDIHYGGVDLKAGEMILIPSPLHGLDERENERPLDVDFHRKQSEHSTFGHGPHRCPGAHLARREVIITIEEWLSRIPDFKVKPDHQIVFEGGIVGCISALPLVWNPAETNVLPIPEAG